ncbi:MAG: YbiU family protein [Granulosicoccus sp.]
MEDKIKDFIRSTKQKLRDSHDTQQSFNSVQEAMLKSVNEIREATERGVSVIPELLYSDIDTEQVSLAMRQSIRHRGCVIVRGVFPEAQARDWNLEIGEYLDRNNYLEKSKKKTGLDNYFGDLTDTAPQIFGIYWSRPQVMVRQAESMAATKRFLNRLWDVSGPMGDEFDPDRDFTYADRTRRRAPGDKSLGLSPHMDSGSYERWVDPAFQAIYEHVFSGNWQQYDPWRAMYRTQTREYKSPAVCSMFRTFQGWTALTSQGPSDGTLKLLPIANAIAYVLLRSLQDDVPDDEFCIARPGRALGIDEHWHPELLAGMVTIPRVNPGDTVWWHPDVVHAVENEHSGKEYASVIYVGASPACAKNEAYARAQSAYFLGGQSAPDFAAENYEVDFFGRATVDDLTELGKQQMAL